MRMKLSSTSLCINLCDEFVGVVVDTPAQVYIGQPSSVFGHCFGVFASMFIEKGTLMGPYTGSRLSPRQVDPCSRERDETIDSNHLWEVVMSFLLHQALSST